MPTERLSVRRIRQILQLHFGAQGSARAIARELGVARSTVQGYLGRASSAELGWPLPADLTDQMLEERLFPPAIPKLGVRRYVEPDWAALVREMKRPGVNLMILWEEYQKVHPEGYGYSRFCELYRASRGGCRRPCARRGTTNRPTGISPNTEALITAVLAHRPHPEQGFRNCMGVLRLFRGIEAARAETVCSHALEIGARSYQSVASILKHGLDHKASPPAADDTPLLHVNIRGSGYFH